MHGIIDLSHRYAFLNKPTDSGGYSFDAQSEREEAKSIHSNLNKILFHYFSNRGYSSIEEYNDHFLSSYDYVKSEKRRHYSLRNVEIFRVFDTFFYWQKVSTGSNQANNIANFIDRRNKLFGNIFKNMGSIIRDVDEENISFGDFVKDIRNIFSVDDVIIWRFNPENRYLTDVGSTLEKKINADSTIGLLGEAIRNKRSLYYPNIRNIKNYEEMLQHPNSFKDNHWKGVVVCPMHSSKNLVGLIGLYSRNDLILSKIEMSLILYLISNLSKRMSREVVNNADLKRSDNSVSFERLFRLAPTIYAGTKTTYRLHSIKNRARAASNSLKSLKRNIKWRNSLEDYNAAFDDTKSEIDRIFTELESCLLLASGKSQRLMKPEKLNKLYDFVASNLKNNLPSIPIERRMSCLFNRDATVICDIIAVEQALFNVIENSFHFLQNDHLEKRDPQIHCSIMQLDNDIVFEIRDNALGMDDNEKDNATTLYFSGDRKKGSGVGLWMTERIVNEHFGEFEIDSDFGGTVCKISLPLKSSGTSDNRVRLKDRSLALTGKKANEIG